MKEPANCGYPVPTMLHSVSNYNWFFSDCFALQMFAMESVAASILTVPSIVKLSSPLILLKHRLYHIIP